MPFLIRPALLSDQEELHRLATSLSAHGFLTLPSDRDDLTPLIEISQRSFGNCLKGPDEGKYLFVLEDLGQKKVVGSSLIMARHGTPQSPHLYFQVDPNKRTLKLQWETTGRTELGGLILDPTFRGNPERLGKRLSFVRLLYIGRNPDRFHKEILAELLPPFTKEGKSALWEALGRKLTGLDYREADERSRRDKDFIAKKFPSDEIRIDSLPKEAQESIGQVGPETLPVAKILEEVGFRYLHQVDPFDGGPHYGALQGEIRQDRIMGFFEGKTDVELRI